MTKPNPHIADASDGALANQATPKASGKQADTFYSAKWGKLPFKYRLPFYGKFYRAWSRFIHRHGYHYAPKEYPIENNHISVGLGGTEVLHWRHWCQWCGLRGSTIDIKRTDLQPSDSEAKSKRANAPTPVTLKKRNEAE